MAYTHTSETTQTLPGEHQLLTAVLRQALLDLNPTASARDRSESVTFFRNAHGSFQTMCDLLGLDHEQVQALVERQYPEVC